MRITDRSIRYREMVLILFPPKLPSKIRVLTLLALALAVADSQAKAPTRSAIQLNDRVRITPRRVVLVRTGQLAKERPTRTRAVVVYPVVGGLADATVLNKVRRIIAVKNVFGSTLKQYRDDWWLDEFGYTVNHNGNYILDITFTQSGRAAYPDVQTRHFAIDLKNGNVLKAADVFDSSGLEKLVEILNGKLQKEVASLSMKAKTELIKEDATNTVDALELQKFESKDLDNFSVGKTGITFLYDAGFPQVIAAYEPSGKYFMSYAELKPFIKRNGMLWQFLS
jgi:hypothetical protein